MFLINFPTIKYPKFILSYSDTIFSVIIKTLFKYTHVVGCEFQFQKIHIVYNQIMSDELEDISQYLNLSDPETLQCTQKSSMEEIKFEGQWKMDQWLLYICYTLIQFKKSLIQNQRIISFRENRRQYKSFDHGYVKFLLKFGIDKINNEEDKKELIKRAKSKFGSLKRSYKQKIRSRSSRSVMVLDYEQYIISEAKNMLENKSSEKSREVQALRKSLQEYQTLKMREQDSNTQTQQSVPHRNQQTIRVIKTRSSSHRQLQNGNTDK